MKCFPIIAVICTAHALLYVNQGVKAVIAESFSESHRRALIGVGVLPLEFVNGQTAHSVELSGKERITIRLGSDLCAHQHVNVMVSTARSVL